MSAGYNCGTILGRLTGSPERLSTKNGKLFIKATIAVSTYQKNSEGAGEERTTLIVATIFNKTAEIFLRFVQVGDMVHLVGRLDSNECTTGSGDKRLIRSFIAETVNLLPNDAKAQQMPGPKPMPQPQQRRAEASQAAGPRRPQPTLNEYGEPNDIPF